MGRRVGWLLALVLGGPMSANAAVVTFAALLNPQNETPPIDTPETANAMGSGFFVFDDTVNLLSWNIAFSGLTENTHAAHIHQGARGTAGKVEINLDSAPGAVLSGIGFPEGIFLGSSVIDDDPDAAAGPDGLITALFAGNLYVNIHTPNNHPGGEIRGQILPGTVQVVPLPAAGLLLVSALGLVGARRLRRG